MTVNELMAQIRTEMTGDLKKDMNHLHDIAEDIVDEPNAKELAAAVAEYALSLLPPDVKADFAEATTIEGKTLDQVFGAALQLVNAKHYDEAETLLAALSEKIEKHFEGNDPRWFSFRNPFEYHMYRYFYPEETNFDRAPFDFARFLSLYGFVLLEKRKAREAEKVLERSIRFNPVSADMRFELAELCKFAQNHEKLLTVNRETLPLCTSADRIARVLANMGYYCYVTQDLYSAAVFYFESIRFQPSKAVDIELQDVLKRMKTFGQKFAPPTHGQTIDTYEKYGLQPPPNSNLVNLAVTLAKSADDLKRYDLERLFLRTAFDLTNDQHFMDEVRRLGEMEAQAPQA